MAALIGDQMKGHHHHHPHHLVSPYGAATTMDYHKSYQHLLHHELMNQHHVQQQLQQQQHSHQEAHVTSSSPPPQPPPQQQQPSASARSISPTPDTPDDNKIFGSKTDLQLHTQIHMREAKPYKCSQCSKSFANSSYLSQHSRIHLGIKPYRCEICQRKFTQLSHLQQHIRTHTGDKPYKCRHPQCTKAFSQLSNLQSHSRCHQTDKPFKCNSCYKCFPDETALLEHIPKHKESKHLKTHICHYCGKSYTQETYLAKHMQKHAERPDKRGRSQAAAAAAAAAAASAAAASASEGRVEGSYWSTKSTEQSANGLDSMNDCVHNGQQEQHRLHDGQHQIHGHHNGSGGGSGGGGAGGGVYDSSKTSTSSVSAFTPIGQAGGGGMLSAQMVSAPAVATRSYFAYDPLSAFAKASPAAQMMGTMTPMEMKSANAFNNQLISLHQIKNYAHHPANLMSGVGPCGTVDFGGLGKDKGQ